MGLVFRRGKLRIFLILLFFAVTLVFVVKKQYASLVHKSDDKHTNVAPSKKVSIGHSVAAPPAIPQPEIPKKNQSVLGRVYTLQGMRDQALNSNFAQKIQNSNRFGDHRADDPVIVIQVHDRPDFLQKTLESLKAVQGIDSATLIISRDKYSSEMDAVVDSAITFCRYMEIFFPFSMQLYPDKFPGEDPNDCPRDLPKHEAKAKGCNNAEFPDQYGHYREVKYVQIKHHWFWKLNMVFSGIREIRDNTGPVLFLEDDNYVSPDLIDVMRKALMLKQSKCPDCLVISLGAYEYSTDYKNRGKFAVGLPWMSTKHNLGMMISNDFYNKLTKCTEYFCTYDDYNWDWTLQATGLKCLQGYLHTIVLKVPRVYHLGCTGFHQKQNGVCNLEEEVQKLKTLFQSQSEYLFPRSLEMESLNQDPNLSHMQNGGWGDKRDHVLCQSYRDLCKNMQTTV